MALRNEYKSALWAPDIKFVFNICISSGLNVFAIYFFFLIKAQSNEAERNREAVDRASANGDGMPGAFVLCRPTPNMQRRPSPTEPYVEYRLVLYKIVNS